MRLNLKRLALLSGTCARAFAARARLTPQRVDLMLLIRQETLTQRELAHRLCVTRPVVTRMLSALREIGLVQRSLDSKDRRRRIVRLTDEGAARLALCFPDPTQRGAQTTGEAEWLAAWRTTLATYGIRVDSILRGRMPRFAGLAAWNRRHGRVDLTNEYEIPGIVKYTREGPLFAPGWREACRTAQSRDE